LSPLKEDQPMQRAVTAIYPSFATASLVREELEQLGIRRGHITVLPETERGTASTMTGTAVGTTGDAFGATSSDYVDTAPAYADADNGAAVDRLHDLGLPEDDTRTYQQALHNGDYVVSVSVDDDPDLSRIQEVMRRPEDAYDLDELDTRYSGAEYVPRGHAGGVQMVAGMEAGESGYDSQQQGFAASDSMRQTTDFGAAGQSGYTGDRQRDDGTIEVVEEDLTVGKRAVDRGAVQVRSYVREEPVSAEVDLRATRVYVDRRPVDRAVQPGDLRDQVLEAHETGEEAVVAKEARVVEEIALRKETEVEHQQIRDTIRKTEVEIEDERTGQTQRITGDDKDRNRF